MSVSRGSPFVVGEGESPVWLSYRGSRSRWMVEASAPQVSESRLAARPVGAVRAVRSCKWSNRDRMPRRGWFFRCPARRW